jgi:hypothetical protein
MKARGGKATRDLVYRLVSRSDSQTDALHRTPSCFITMLTAVFSLSALSDSNIAHAGATVSPSMIVNPTEMIYFFMEFSLCSDCVIVLT